MIKEDKNVIEAYKKFKCVSDGNGSGQKRHWKHFKAHYYTALEHMM